MNDQRGRTSLTSHAPLMRDPDPDGAWSFAKRQWHQFGVATFIPDEVERYRGFLAAQEVRNLAEQCYGKREQGDKRDGEK